MTRVLGVVDRPVLIAFGFIVVLLVLGAMYNRQFLSGLYLLQQLRVASFLGIIASGVMLVILLGHIDLSIPWVVTMGGLAATAIGGCGNCNGFMCSPRSVTGLNFGASMRKNSP